MFTIHSNNGFYAETIRKEDALTIAKNLNSGVVFVFDDDNSGKLIYVDGVKFDMPIEECDFSVRTYNVLKRAGIDTIGAMFDSLNLYELHHMSGKRYDEIAAFADACGEVLACEHDALAVAAIAGLYAIAERENINLTAIPEFDELDSYIYAAEMGDIFNINYATIARYVAKIQSQFPQYKKP